MDGRNHSSVLYRSRQYLDELALVDRVKILFQVHVHYIFVAFCDVGLVSSARIMRASPRSETKAVVRELFLQDWAQDLAYRLLD